MSSRKRITPTPAAKSAPTRAAKRRAQPTNTDDDVQSVLTWLERHGTRAYLDGLARFGIHAEKAFGVSMKEIQELGKKLGRKHPLADALWDTGWYEARLLTAFVADPAQLTSAQMDRWCRDFDSWAVCDTLCFHLFDRTPHAWRKVEQWSTRKAEFEKRAAFALLASLAGHDKAAEDASFLERLPLIERAASDERNFVKKAVSWALRGIGHRNPALHGAAMTLARRLADSPERAARWVGKDALRDLTRPAVTRRLEARAQRS